ncbi:MAG TPA: hypothetical protein VD704_10360 [Gaiellaceae bacterium]|nr:hypothetical protein [Gaiellaceae bacterium]
MLRAAALAGALVLATVVFGCGGDDEERATPPETSSEAQATPPAPEPGESGAAETGAGPEGASPAALADAALRTAEIGSARVATEVTLTGLAEGDQTFSGEGVFDFERNVGEMTLDVGGAPETGIGSTQLVFQDFVVYYGLPEGILPAGKRWLRLDLQSVADASGIDFGSLIQGTQADPSQLLLWLAALGPEAEELGEEDVQGVPTTRYRATVDLRRLESQAPEGAGEEWRAYVQSLATRLGTTEVPVEISVDGDGYVRRLRQELPLAGTAGELSTIVTTDLFDFGVEVDVQAPPAGEVAAIDDLIRP